MVCSRQRACVANAVQQSERVSGVGVTDKQTNTHTHTVVQAQVASAPAKIKQKQQQKQKQTKPKNNQQQGKNKTNKKTSCFTNRVSTPHLSLSLIHLPSLFFPLPCSHSLTLPHTLPHTLTSLTCTLLVLRGLEGLLGAWKALAVFLVCCLCSLSFFACCSVCVVFCAKTCLKRRQQEKQQSKLTRVHVNIDSFHSAKKKGAKCPLRSPAPN